MTLPAEIIHTSINCSKADVYAYVSDPKNMGAWASGLSESRLVREGKSWVSDSPMGRIKIDFTPPNEFGVVDHDVTLPNGSVVHNALRVQPNGEGAEVLFTLLRQPNTPDADYAKDAARVRDDLARLKKILEQKH